MALRAATLIILSVLHVCSPDSVRRPASWFLQCRSSTNLSITALEVLPGGGWDNLRNVDMGRVMNFNYSQCQTTEDGFYFVPDDVFVIPQKVTNVETYAEIISSWLEHKSTTSYTINRDASGNSEEYGELNGRFSAEHQRVKTKINGKSTTTRVQIRNNIYTVNANPDFTLDSHFVQQVEDIAEAIANNQTRLATYLSEKLVADYGTHVITSVDAGANLVKEDYIKSSSVSDSDSDLTSIKASAGYSFFSLFTIDAENSYKHDESEQSKYDSSITSSFMEGHGGSPFYPGMHLDNWQESTRNNVVGIDRAGLPLHYVINTNTLPDLPEPIVNKVALSLQQAIERYYTVNTHPGCVNHDSPNFNFQANVEDNSCEGVGLTKPLFGGVFQLCEPETSELCQKLVQKNPATGDYTCSPLQQILLRSEEKEEAYSERECKTEEYSCGHETCTHNICKDVLHARSIKVYTYWCYSSDPTPDPETFNEFLLLFGGFYGNSFNNPFTKRRDCLEHFAPIKFMNDVMICLRKNDKPGAAAILFGGFFSCDSTNPFTEGRHCPFLYSQHLLTVSDGCPIYYCVDTDYFRLRVKQLLPVRLPPFTRPPVIGLKSNSNTIKVLTEGNQSWVKVGQSNWTRAATDNVQDVIKKSATDSADVSGEKARIPPAVVFIASRATLSLGEKAGIGLGTTSLVIVMIGGVVLTVWCLGLTCK